MEINSPREPDRRDLTRNLLALSLAMPTVLTMANPRTAAAAAMAGTFGPERTVKFRDGTVVPALGQGSARLGQGRQPQTVEEEALREGISLIARVIAGQRERVFLVSKVWPTHVAGNRN